MDKETIINYLQRQVDWRTKSIIPMDKRHKIPRKISNDIKELKDMIKYLK